MAQLSEKVSHISCFGHFKNSHDHFFVSLLDLRIVILLVLLVSSKFSLPKYLGNKCSNSVKQFGSRLGPIICQTLICANSVFNG